MGERRRVRGGHSPIRAERWNCQAFSPQIFALRHIDGQRDRQFFLLGFLWGHGASETTMLLLGTGFMGAFTTFSTFKLEAEAFFSDGRRNNAWTYLGVSYTLGILLAAAGYAI